MANAYGKGVRARLEALKNTKMSSSKATTGGSKSSPYHGMLHMQKLGGHDDTYGRPVEGSRTEFRVKSAGVHISREIIALCEIIQSLGCSCADGTVSITFGELFETYTKISNKLVGMLMRARKQGLIDFEGEMLFQRRDDHVLISLLKMPEELMEDVEKRKEELKYHSAAKN